MSSYKRFTAILLLSILTFHANAEMTLDDAREFAQDIQNNYLHERVEIGLRSSHFTLFEDKEQIFDAQGTFRGGYTRGISIDRMEVEQDYMPNLFLRVHINRYIGVELGYEKFEIATGKFWDSSTDGSILGEGPSLQLLGKYPNHTRFTPYGGVGIVFLNMDWDHDPIWHYGFNGANGHTYGAWRAAGSDPTVNGGTRRNIGLDNTRGTLLTAGCQAQIWEGFHADLAAQMMQADVDAEYFISWHGRSDKQPRADWTFPLDGWRVLLSLVYAF